MTRFADSIVSGDIREGVTGTALMALYASFDPTSASQVLLGALPVGAVPVAIQSFGGGTGGSSPTVKVGTSTDDDAFGASVDADTLTALVASGAGYGVATTAVTSVYGKVGSSVATGGTTRVALYYVRP